MAFTQETSSSSTASLVEPQRSEDAFPTPPRENRPPPSLRVRGKMSPAPKKLMEMARAASTPPETTRDHAMRSLPRGTPGGLPELSKLESSWQRKQALRKKSQYFEEAFAYRELNNTAKDRVVRDSVIIADLKLNPQLAGHSIELFLRDLSFQLSEIYQRPEESIMVIYSYQAHMMFGGCDVGNYFMTITALQSDVSPFKNKRVSSLLQNFMTSALCLAPDHGIVRFEGVPEGNLATRGVTVQQEIEDLEQQDSSEYTGVLRTISRQGDRRNKKGAMPIYTERGKTPRPSSRAMTPSHLKMSSATSDHTTSDEKRVKRRRSIMSFFRRTD